jgi:hypothetical protein
MCAWLFMIQTAIPRDRVSFSSCRHVDEQSKVCLRGQPMYLRTHVLQIPSSRPVDEPDHHRRSSVTESRGSCYD